MKIKAKILLLQVLLLVATLCSGQQDTTPSTIDQQVILRLTDDIDPGRLSKKYSHLGLKPIKAIGHTHHFYLFEVGRGLSVERAIGTLKKDVAIRSIQPNRRVQFYGEPNDSLFAEQWNMATIRMPQVWEFGTGGLTTRGDTIVIAIVDSGFKIDHPDLSPNIWHNQREIPANGIDDDGNGYIDDVTGWNFKEDSPIHGESKHGHAVAGLAGAKGDNEIGISGVNQTIKLLVLDIETFDEIVAAYEYIYDLRNQYNLTKGQKGAYIVATNASWGLDNTSCDQFESLKDMYLELGKAGILTAVAPPNTFHDVDRTEDTPVTCPSEHIIGVLNTTRENTKVYESAYGKKSIDLGVPGDEVPSLALNGYKLFSGNSAAAPQLTGAIGLLYSLACPDIIEKSFTEPSETALFFKEIILNSAFKFDALKDYCATGGRLNVQDANLLLQSACNSTTGDLEILNIYPNPAHNQVRITFESPDFNRYDIIVYNSIGKRMLLSSVTPFVFGEKYFTLDVSQFPTGVYEIVLIGGQEIASGKVVVY